MSSINNSDSNNTNEILGFSDECNDQIPQEMGLTKDVDMNNKNFFIASLQLLTNIASLYSCILCSASGNNIYINLWSSFSKKEKEVLKENIRKLNNYVLKKLLHKFIYILFPEAEYKI